jgi:hypothetical protein
MLGQRANCPRTLNTHDSRIEAQARGLFRSYPRRNGLIRFNLVPLKVARTSTVHHGRANLVGVAGLSVGVAGVVLELGG